MAETYVDKVAAAVRQVPSGCVASYGTIGEVAGYARHGRHVGRVMRVMTGVPWWRVLRADGMIVIRDAELAAEQESRLVSEGVVVVERRVDMSRYAWDGRTRS